MTRDIKQQRREFTRQAVLNAAIEMVTSSGISGFSMRALAREVGFGPATLYEYFRDKDDVIRSIMAFGTALLASYLRRATDRSTVREQLQEVCVQYMAFADEHPKLYLLMFTHLDSERESVDIPLPEDNPYGAYVTIVERGLRTGEIRGSDQSLAEPIAFGLWSLVHGMVMLQMTHLRKFSSQIAPGRTRIVQQHIDGITDLPSSHQHTEEQ